MQLNLKDRESNIIGPCGRRPVKEPCHSCILDASGYFAGLSAPEKRALQQLLTLAVFARRDTLYVESADTDCLYILVSGEVKVYKTLADGRQQIHRLITIPGDLIACEDFFLDTHSSAAEAIAPTTVCYLNKQRLRAILGEHRQIADTLMQFMARNINAYIRHIANLGQKTALERVASYLTFLFATHGERNLRGRILTQSLTRSELADMLGITQRTLIRSLKRLEADGVISLAPTGFIILDMPVLAQIGES